MFLAKFLPKKVFPFLVTTVQMMFTVNLYLRSEILLISH